MTCKQCNKNDERPLILCWWASRYENPYINGYGAISLHVECIGPFVVANPGDVIRTAPE